MVWAILVSLTWSGLSRAHIPHDEVLALAAPEDLDASAPWLLLMRPHMLPLLMRSEDGGESWDFITGAPLWDELVDASGEGGALALLGEQALWWTEDGGERWEYASLPSTSLGRLLLRRGVWVAGDEGLWRAEGLGEPWSQLADCAIVALGDGEGGVVWADEDGEVWLQGPEEDEDDQHWLGEDEGRSLGVPAEGVTAVATADGVVYLGTDAGRLLRWSEHEGSWGRCGDIEVPAEGWPAILRLAVDGDRLWVGTGGGEVYESEDGCATLSPLGAPMTPETGTTGGADSASAVLTALQVEGERALVGGWAGLALSLDRGETWQDLPLLGPAYTRGLAASPDGEGAPRVWVGAYAAGVMLSEDGGLSYQTPGPGQNAENIQRVAQRPGRPDEIWALADHETQLSLDAGATWTRPTMPFAMSFGLILLEDRVGVVGREEEGPFALAWTEDDGASWVLDDALIEALGDSDPVGGVSFDGRTCVLGGAPTALVCEEGGAWSLVFSGEGEQTAGPAVLDTVPPRLVIADEDAVSWTEDLLRWESARPLYRDAPTDLVAGVGGVAWMSTRTGRLLRGDGGGEGWTDLGVSLGAAAFQMEHLDGVAGGPGLLMATPDGVEWVSALEAERATVERWSGLERVEGSSWFVDCPLCAPEGWEGAGLGTVERMGVGATLRVSVRGEEIAVLGAIDESSVALVLVDGASAGSIAGAGHALEDGPLWSISGLAAGWHELTLIGLEGGGIVIDAVEGRSEGLVLALDDGRDETGLAETGLEETGLEETGGGAGLTPKPAGCACTSGGRGSGEERRAGLGILALLALSARRGPPRAGSGPAPRRSRGPRSGS